MSFSVRYTDQAAADLFRNAHWWAEHHSLDEALAWEAAMETQIATLAEHPTRHALAPENDDFPFEIHQKLIGLGSRPSYRAIYTIHGDTVFVLAVHRGTQDRITPEEIDFDPA